jgi:hypothetical protein
MIGWRNFHIITKEAYKTRSGRSTRVGEKKEVKRREESSRERRETIMIAEGGAVYNPHSTWI